MRGNIEIHLKEESQEGEILIPKIVNYTHEFLNNLACYVVATKEPVHRNFIKLQKGEYQTLMKCSIMKSIKPESSEHKVVAKGMWNQVEEDFINFVLILYDESKKSILYWLNYLDPEKLLAVIRSTYEKKCYRTDLL